MMGLTPFDASCLFENTNGQVSSIKKELSSETCIRIDLEETTESAPIRKTILRAYTLTKSSRASWMSFDNNWTSCTALAKFHHLEVHMERVAR